MLLYLKRRNHGVGAGQATFGPSVECSRELCDPHMAFAQLLGKPSYTEIIASRQRPQERPGDTGPDRGAYRAHTLDISHQLIKQASFVMDQLS